MTKSDKGWSHPMYGRWRAMINRCYYPEWINYHDYGGRGIKVCDRWRTSFHNFWEDMGPSWSPGLFIDRKDNAGDYCPQNCRWATKVEQMNNMRSNHIVEFSGRSQTIAQWEKELGVRRGLIKLRLWRGWPVAEAFNLNHERRDP